MATRAARYAQSFFGDEGSGLIGLPGASILIREAGTVVAAPLWANRTKTTTLANPLPTGVPYGTPGLDIDGNAVFFADPGTVELGSTVYEAMVTVGNTTVGPVPIGTIPPDMADVQAPIEAGTYVQATPGDLRAVPSAITAVALTAAMAATPADGTLVLPAGEFDLTTWTPPSRTTPIRIVGAGKGQTIITGPGDATTDFLLCSESVTLSGCDFRDFRSAVDFTGTLTTLARIDIRNNAFDGCGSAIQWRSGDGTAGVRALHFRGNDWTNGVTITAGTGCLNLQVAVLEKAVVRSNTIDGVYSRGIQIGWDGSANNNADIKSVQVHGNTIANVTNIGTSSAMGIIVYGQSNSITGNTVREVTRPGSADVDGIYTKSFNSLVANNVLHNAGGHEACINLKGGLRGNLLAAGVAGYSVNCHSNVITANSAECTIGINIATEGVWVENNHVEGMANRGIAFSATASGNDIMVIRNRILNGTITTLTDGVTTTGSPNLSSATAIFTAADVGTIVNAPGVFSVTAYITAFVDAQNVTMNTNALSDQAAMTFAIMRATTDSPTSDGIRVAGVGSRIYINDNTIFNVTTHGIYCGKARGTQVEIIGNTVMPLGAVVSPSAYAIRIDNTGVITDMVITDNKIRKARYGIRFTGTAPDLVFIRRNNIPTSMLNGSSPLAIDYASTTPTNLTITDNEGFAGSSGPGGLVVPGRVFARKLSDTTYTSSTPANDPHLAVSLEASTTYTFDLIGWYDGVAAGDFRGGFTVPAGATIIWHQLSPTAAATSGASTSVALSVSEGSTIGPAAGAIGAATKMAWRAIGVVVMGGTAGSLQFRAQQATTDATPTTLFANSVLIAQREEP